MTIAAVILAAGASRRFGAANKLLADVGGEPLIARVVKRVAGTGCSRIVVVTAVRSGPIRAALDGLPVTLVANPAAARGMGTSIAAGIASLAPDVSAALIVPGDMPNVSTALIDALIAAFQGSGSGRIVHAAARDGTQRNPVLWPRTYFSDLARLDGDHGGKSLLAAHRSDTLAVTVARDDELIDVDTMDDLVRPD